MSPILLAALGASAYFFLDKKAEASEQLTPDTKFDPIIKKYSNQKGLDWKLVKAIILKESSYGRAASVARGIAAPWDVEGSKSGDGKSWGLMQTTIPTARDFQPGVTAVELNNPETSIKIGTDYLEYLFNLFDKTRDVVMAYNQGQGNQDRFIQLEKSGKLKTTDFPAARSYYEGVMKFYNQLG